MQADRETCSAYPVPLGLSRRLDRPFAGFSGIAYRLADLAAPRLGLLFCVSALFYFA